MGGIDIHDVKVRLLGAKCGLTMPAAQFTDIGFVHRPGLIRMPCQVRDAGHIGRGRTSVVVR